MISFDHNTAYVYQISLLYCIVSHFIGLHCAAVASTMLFILQFFFLHLLSPCTLLLDIARYKSFFEIEQSAKRSTLSHKIVLFSFSIRGKGLLQILAYARSLSPELSFMGFRYMKRKGFLRVGVCGRVGRFLVLFMIVIEMFQTDDTMILNYYNLS